MRDLLFHNFHPPNDVRVFAVPREAIQRLDAVALVYDVRVRPDLVLRHYSWSEHWFDVNCSFSPRGDLVEEDGPIRWAFNCDISTPHALVKGDAYNMDLELDVLVGRDGVRHCVRDRESLTHACNSGWIDAAEAAGAERGLAELLTLLEQGHFRSFLEATCPFSTLRTSAVQRPPRHKALGQVPPLHPSARRAHAGLSGSTAGR